MKQLMLCTLLISAVAGITSCSKEKGETSTEYAELEYRLQTRSNIAGGGRLESHYLDIVDGSATI